jgi:hypothetical protein
LSRKLDGTNTRLIAAKTLVTIARNRNELNLMQRAAIQRRLAVASNIEDTIREVIAKAQKETRGMTEHDVNFDKRIKNIVRKPCVSCKIMLFERQRKIWNEAYETESSKAVGVKSGSIVCDRCCNSMKADKIPGRSWRNKLELDPIPDVLAQLTFLERRFVCRLQTYMTLLVLPGGQYAQKGLAIHFPDEPKEVLSILPRRDSNSGVICTSGNYKGVIRPLRLYCALTWLKHSNPLYDDIDIDLNQFRDLSEQPSCSLDTVIETGMIPTDYDFPTLSIKELLKQGFSETVNFPRSNQHPKSFADTPHAECLAYPWLFPKGRHDASESRKHRLTLLDYLQSRLLHEDNRFRTDIPYLMNAVNR